MKNEMKKIYYQVVENVLPQVYLLYNSFNNKFILLNNVRYEKYKKENILKQLNMIATDDIDKFIKSLIDIKPQSTYAISGSHEGLGLKHYCHSTSPERRFADLWNRYLNKRCRMENSNDPDIYKLEKETKRVIERINEQLILSLIHI